MLRFTNFKRYTGLAGILALAAWAGGSAFSQQAPLEIPFVNEWASSPHARLTAPAFQYWNEQGEVPVPCARCHTTSGFRDYIGADGTPPGLDGPGPTGGVIACVACHNDVTMKMTSVTFPSGLEVTDAGDDARCMSCHQGRESTVSVNESLAGLADDEVSDKIRFINIHYRAAGATRYGTQAKGGYEYEGKTYVGYYVHDKDYKLCADCHQQHTVKVKVDECGSCHKTPEIKVRADLLKIRKSKVDFDGNGNVEEGIAEEIKALHAVLLGAIQKYGAEVSKTAIGYSAGAYPYFFIDTDGDGKIAESEAVPGNRYASWTPRLLRAAYNYQYVAKDPGVYTHNPAYVIQLLYDGIEDMSTKVTVDREKTVRPKL